MAAPGREAVIRPNRSDVPIEPKAVGTQRRDKQRVATYRSLQSYPVFALTASVPMDRSGGLSAPGS